MVNASSPLSQSYVQEIRRFALFSSANANAIMSSIDRKYYGVASATMGTVRVIGDMLSMGITMIALTVFVGRVQVTPEYFQSFLLSVKIAFVAFAVLCFGGIFASITRGKVR